MAEPSGGGKRKYKENSLTAKAESGTLRVKILRKDQQQQAMLLAAGGASGAAPVRSARGAKTHGKSAAPPSPDSPPKPRPNRKHVPIFYQQKRRPRAENGAASDVGGTSASHALDLSQFSSSSSASSASALSNDYSGTGMSASTSSTGTPYASLLSGLQLDSTTSSSGNGGGVSTSSAAMGSTSIADLLPPPPAANPLFSRSDSDGLGALSELLRPHFPSATGPSFPLSGASSGILAPHMLLSAPMASSAPSVSSSTSIGSSRTSSSNGGFSNSVGSTAALHQLASSSQHYRSALDALSAATIQSGSLDMTASTSPSLPAVPLHPSLGSLATDKQAEPASSSAAHENGDASVSEYKFNPLSALQSAIDHAQLLSQTLAASKSQGELSSSSSSRPSAERNGNRSSSIDGGIQHLLDDGSDEDAASSAPLGPPPSAPPAFSVQNSLMGGGIEALISSSKSGSPNRDKGKATASTPPLAPPSRDLSLLLDAPNANTDGDLGPPPAAPPAFRIENSLMGGGIETQPMIANVNTHNFDWKFHNAAGKLLKSSAIRGSNKSCNSKVVDDGDKRDGEGNGRPDPSSSTRRDADKDSREAIL